MTREEMIKQNTELLREFGCFLKPYEWVIKQMKERKRVDNCPCGQKMHKKLALVNHEEEFMITATVCNNDVTIQGIINNGYIWDVPVVMFYSSDND